MILLSQVIILLFIVFVKAIFTSADTAFTYLNRAEIFQLSKKDKKAKKIRILMEDSNKFFGIIEVGINMCELVASAFVSLTFIEQFAHYLSQYMDLTVAMGFSVAIATIILSYILLVFGAVIPKRLARRNPKKVAYNIISILWLFSKINYPFEKLIHFSTEFFSNMLTLSSIREEKLTEKQLKMIIREAKDEGIISTVEKNIAIKALNANNTHVSKIMIPMEKVECLDINHSISTILKNLEENKYSRMPVYEGDSRNIIGTIYFKDLIFKYAKTGIKDNSNIRELLRKPLFITEDERILTVFKKMQKQNHVMAIIVNEVETPIGIITTEDILERLVGKIFDEDDKRD